MPTLAELKKFKKGALSINLDAQEKAIIHTTISTFTQHDDGTLTHTLDHTVTETEPESEALPTIDATKSVGVVNSMDSGEGEPAVTTRVPDPAAGHAGHDVPCVLRYRAAVQRVDRGEVR